MKWYECAGIGVLMACLYALTLWSSLQIKVIYAGAVGVDLLNNASSEVKYTAPLVYSKTQITAPLPDLTYVPYEITGITMIVAFAILFSYPVWYPYAEQALNALAESIVMDEDEDDE